MSRIRFDSNKSNGAIFSFDPLYPLTSDTIVWIGEARGEIEVPDSMMIGIILATPSSLQTAWLPQVSGLSFENPFDLRQSAKTTSAELIEAIKMVTSTCRQAVHHDLLKLKTAINLRWLNLARADIGDESLPALDAIPYLQSLNLSQTPVTDEGVRSLATHRGLIELQLNATNITSNVREIAQQQFPRLQHLAIEDTAVT